MSTRVGPTPGCGRTRWRWHAGRRPADESTARARTGASRLRPWRLRMAGYDPWVHTVGRPRAARRHPGRPVMGLFRLFWIPNGTGPAAAPPSATGTGRCSTSSPWSHRAGAYIVGEGLGRWRDFVRAELYERGVAVLPLAVVRAAPPAGLPGPGDGPRSPPTTSTTIAGMWTGADLAEQHDTRSDPNEEGRPGHPGRLSD